MGKVFFSLVVSLYVCFISCRLIEAFPWDHITMNFARTRDKRAVPDTNCQDIRSTCKVEDCQNNPFEALVNCASTCNNCDGCTCNDASGYDSKCAVYKMQKDLCTIGIFYKTCLQSCNQCSKIQKPSCITTTITPAITEELCSDIFSNCTVTLCDQQPYRYLPNCRLTCNNCHRCKCYDTASAFGGPLCNNTAVTADGLLCRTEATYKRCPKKCNRCTDFQPSSCVSITPTITSMSSQNTASSTQSQQAISTENQQPFISMQPSADSSPVSTIQSPPSTSASQSARQGPSSSTQPSPSTSAVKTIAVI